MDETAAGEAAASRAGLARGAYAAAATLAAARGESTRLTAPLREALAELIRSAGLVRRVGVNLNQAVAKLNATGQSSGDLLPYAAECARRARRLDEAAGTALDAVTSRLLVPSNYWRAEEVIAAVATRAEPQARELREAYREICTSTSQNRTRPLPN